MVGNIILTPIGVVRSVFKNPEDTKRKRIDIYAEIEILKEYETGLKGLDGFSHISVLFYFHLSREFNLIAKPPRHNPNNRYVGVFATHSPYRPNFLGVSVVKLKKIESNILFIENKDILNNSPVVDIKPYIPKKIDDNIKLGWYLANE